MARNLWSVIEPSRNLSTMKENFSLYKWQLSHLMQPSGSHCILSYFVNIVKDLTTLISQSCEDKINLAHSITDYHFFFSQGHPPFC